MTVKDTIFSTNEGRKRCILTMETAASDNDAVWNPVYERYERFDIIDYPEFLDHLEDYLLADLADKGEQTVCYIFLSELTKFDIAYEYYNEEFICR